MNIHEWILKARIRHAKTLAKKVANQFSTLHHKIHVMQRKLEILKGDLS